MNYKVLKILMIGIPILFITSSLKAQDAGFFLNDWQEKTAEVPAFDLVEKPESDPSVTISVDVKHEINKVPKYIYGNNAVVWDSGLRQNATAMKDLKNLNPHVLRWPGGNLSNNYFWNLSSSNAPADIPESIDPWFGQNTQNWQTSTDQYYDLLAETNSTGIICVNYSYARYGTGPDPVAKAAHMAAEWVRYDNGRSGFWEIGNENFGNWQSGYIIDTALNNDGQPEYISGELYGQHCKVFIDSMRAAAAEIGVDIKIGVVAFDAETSWDPIQTVWNEGMMEQVGDLADFLVVHSYFTPYDENSTVSTILNSHDVPQEIMAAMVADMAEAGKPMIPLAMTEWNIFAEGSMQMVSYVNGMLATIVLGEYAKNGYGLAARWDLTNGWSNGNDHGMFSVGGEPGVDPYNPRPVFFYMTYFQKYFGDRMIESSVTGNSKVLAFASKFDSGETGMVIINKSRTDETVHIEFDNFIPGAQYYYHVLTGGDDNGDFSRKVFLNGQGTNEQGGGPDNYEDIKAFASKTDGGIVVDLPALSVVYLMVDKTPPPSYVYSRIDANAAIISVDLTDNVMLADNPAGFEVIINETTAVGITRIEPDPENAKRVYIYLDQNILTTDEMTLSYSGSDIMSKAGSVPLIAFSNATVDNLLPGSAPRLLGATTNSDGNQIQLAFNKKMTLHSSSLESFDLFAMGDPDLTLNLSDIAVDEADSSKLFITSSENLYAGYRLALSYHGSGLESVDGGVLGAFDTVSIINLAPGMPPEILSAKVTNYGFAIVVEFNKPLNDVSNHTALFTAAVNNESYTINAIQSEEQILTLLLDSNIKYGDEVTLSYEGTEISATDRGKLAPFSDLAVDNLLTEPTVYNIPGIIDAEQFTINMGMATEATTDVGGGNNLGNIDAGDWVEYEINVIRTGFYTGLLRVAANSQTGLMVIQTPDGDVLDQDTVSIPITGGWQTWESVPVEIILHEDPQQLRFKALTPYYNINWLSLKFDRTLEANVISAMSDETGNTISIAFDRSIVAPSTGEENAFQVMADGIHLDIEQVLLNDHADSIIELTLETPLAVDNDIITVAYTPGTLTDTDNISVPAFSDITVLNNVITFVENIPLPDMELFPNPFDDQLTIISSNQKIIAVELFDITGKQQFYKEYNSPQERVKLTIDLPSGLYLVKATVSHGVLLTRVVVKL
jgi:uncharacterized repeat protein (TIGR02059 family)